jgi:ubiquitin-protein ligase
MPIYFQPLSMMELRSAPGDILDRVAQRDESFIVERNGHQMACLVPLSLFMPDIQASRLRTEYERVGDAAEEVSTSITGQRELEMHFKNEGSDRGRTISVRLPHGYPNVAPKIFITPLPDECPHRWKDGSLCIFGATEIWNPGVHDVLHVLRQARQWLRHMEAWHKTGDWSEANAVT